MTLPHRHLGWRTRGPASWSPSCHSGPLQLAGEKSNPNKRAEGKKEKPARTLVDHLLDGARRVDFHGEKIIKAVNLRCFFGEFLPERIREIVRGVSRLYAVRLCDGKLT
jgi:hypothetical protein